MEPIVLDHVEAHEKLTARLFWKRVTESGFNDAGNVKEYADGTTRTLVTRARAADGARHVNDEQTDVNHESWTFLLDERDAAQETLLKAALQLSNVTQVRAEAATASITNVQLGKWFTIGAYNIANVAVNASSSGALDEGTDYELDVENGRIKILSDAVVSAGETLTLTFDEPEIEFQKFRTQDNVNFYCDIILEEHSQFSKMFLRRMAFKGFINVLEFPNQTGEFATYRVKVTPSAPVEILKRPEAQTLPDTVETTEPAGRSSSSSSSSSATSSHSSSSVSSASS